MGGEEFAVVLPHTDASAAEPLANRLREAVSATLVRTSSGTVRFTISVGVAVRSRADANVLETISRADRALYDAKHAGRNRVMPARTISVVRPPPQA
jgi:diguanylate cyclase (GGDEF)-like protein